MKMTKALFCVLSLALCAATAAGNPAVTDSTASDSIASDNTASAVPQWFRSAVIYQVYPRSFADSDGDGMGDLNGITQKLDYIRDLGCNTLWINACFASEFRDGGYDVTDYYTVAPRYGTNADMRRLIDAAHARGMYVLLDLVAGHTSDRHPWFLQSKRGGDGPYSRRYIWTADTAVCPPKFVRPEPAAAADTAGVAGADSVRNGNYLKNYFPFQPALNYGYGIVNAANPWEEPLTAPAPTATRRELMRIMDFWAGMGCDGFRIDMAGSLVKNDPQLTATAQLWNEVRAHYRTVSPQGVLLAEWGHPDKARRIGFTADFLFQFGLSGWRDLFCNETGVYRRDTCYFDTRGLGSPRRFIAALTASLDSLGNDGMVCLPTGNHDVQRLNCGRRDSDAQFKAALAFLLLQPCVPCIYYGDEIAMRYREDMPDIEGSVIAAGNRAGSRTPMEWERVPGQMADSASIYNTVRRLLQLRRLHPALAAGGKADFLTDTAGAAYPLAFVRSDGNETFLIAVNPSGRSVTANYTCPLPASAPAVVAAGGDGDLTAAGDCLTVRLAPVSYAVWRL